MSEHLDLPAMFGRCCHLLMAAVVACVTHAADVSPDAAGGAGEAAMDVTQWSAICSERANVCQRYSDDDVNQLQKQLQARLDALEHAHPSLARDDEPWHDYLMWKEIRCLAAGASLDDASLDRLEMRWFNAPLAWDAEEVTAAAEAALQSVRARRSVSRKETPEQQAAAWNQLAQLLKDPERLTPAERQTVAEVLWERERLGQSSVLTASVRSAISRPNLVVQVRRPWFEAQHAVEVDEPFNTRGLVAGAHTVSSGRLTGCTACRFLPNPSGVQWSLSFQGESNSSSVSCSRGVRVKSRATTTVSGEKRFRLSTTGMASDPAEATVSTDLDYSQISAPGLYLRRTLARQRAVARRPVAEKETSNSVRDSVCAHLDDSGQEAVDSFNRAHASFRDRFASADRMAPQVQIRVDDEWLTWEARLEGRGGFAASQNAPVYQTEAPLAIHISADALEEYALATLGEERFSQEELAEAIGKLFTKDGEVPPMGESFEVEFAARPVLVRLQDDHLLLSLFITAFESDGTTYPAMAVDVDYAFRLRDERVTFVREGTLKVKPLVVDNGEGGPSLTGRQQTLLLVAKRKLSLVLGTEFLWSGPTVPVSNAPDSFRISELRARDDWLQFALIPE